MSIFGIIDNYGLTLPPEPQLVNNWTYPLLPPPPFAPPFCPQDLGLTLLPPVISPIPLPNFHQFPFSYETRTCHAQITTANTENKTISNDAPDVSSPNKRSRDLPPRAANRRESSLAKTTINLAKTVTSDEIKNAGQKSSNVIIQR